MTAAELAEKLDLLIRIQAALAVKDMPTQKEKIVFLYGAGLKPKDIAGLLGTTPNTVNVAVANHKKANKKGSAE
jgi:DNA-binding CsgD family transcriptional regulator